MPRRGPISEAVHLIDGNPLAEPERGEAWMVFSSTAE
jgi:hypothetical protein